MLGDYACWLIGVTVSQCSHSAELTAEAQVAAFRTYRPDSISIGPGKREITAAGYVVASLYKMPLN